MAVDNIFKLLTSDLKRGRPQLANYVKHTVVAQEVTKRWHTVERERRERKCSLLSLGAPLIFVWLCKVNNTGGRYQLDPPT